MASSASACPSCGQYVGPYEACPHCGAELRPRITMRAFRYGSLLVALVGLGLLWFFSVRSPVPTLKIGQIQSTMNFAYVRVLGRVVRSPTYDPEGGYLGFWIEDDAGGQMMVSSYRSTTQALVEAGKLPDVGDEVVLEGTLRIRDELPSLTLASAETMRLVRSEAVSCKIGGISPRDALTAVTVRGLVREVKTPYEGLTLIALRDETGAIDVAVGESAVAMLGDVPEVQAGDSVEVSGVVTLYKDTPQVALTVSGRLVRLGEPVEIAPFSRISELDAGRVGGYARVEGEVIQVKPFSAGVKLTLDDGSGRVVVLVWGDVYAGLADRTEIVEGAIVSAQGEISRYRGEMELVVELPSDVTLLARRPITGVTQKPAGQSTAASRATVRPKPSSTPASTPTPGLTSTPQPTPTPLTPTPTPEPTATPLPAALPIEAITRDTLGQVVTIKGQVVDVTSSSAGFKFWLDDGTGRLDLFLSTGVYGYVPNRSGLNLGAQVLATGELKDYKGVLEVVPAIGEDVVVLAPGDGARAPQKAIGAVGEGDEDRFVTIQGTILAKESLKGGTRLRVGDDSGEVDVIVWDNVMAYVPGAGQLVESAKVTVTGKVGFFRGALQVVPQLGYDVRISD